MNSVEGAYQSGNAVVDHRKRRRRRGAALYAAIFEATLEELTAFGYAELTMERVARRAGASKTSLYPRWPGRAELVVDAIHHTLPSLGEPPDTGSAREDLLACLRTVAILLNGLSGEAIRGEVRATALTPRIASVGPDLLRQLFPGAPPPDPRPGTDRDRRRRDHASNPPLTHPNRVRNVAYPK